MLFTSGAVKTAPSWWLAQPLSLVMPNTLAQSLDCTERTSTLRDSFRANFSVGEGHSLSTPLNILVSDWKEKKIDDEEEEEFAQMFPFVQPFIKNNKN